MRTGIHAVAILTAVAALPFAAHAQERIIIEQPGVTTGVTTEPPVSVLGPDGRVITAIDQPRLRRYIVEERVPSYALEGPVAVGTVLPENGVTYYEVPQQYGATPYRYSVVNDRPILVEPRTRRVIQVLE